MTKQHSVKGAPVRRQLCPNGHGDMKLTIREESVEFRGEDFTIEAKYYVCPECGIEIGTADQTTAIQKAISNVYREKAGLLTGDEIRNLRRGRSLSQHDLAERIPVGIASVKRWEGSSIQNRSMDRVLRMVLTGEEVATEYSGNREFSTARLKLVIIALERILEKPLLVKNDRFLFTSKYLWYADMVSFRDMGKSMTGSSYAALPLGPQLNNYKDLVRQIMTADETTADPLTEEELRILRSIAKRFPKKWDVYNAAHRETIWKKRKTGEIIPYSASVLLENL